MLRMNRNITIILTLGMLSATAAAFAQNDSAQTPRPRSGDPAAGKTKSVLCQGCHGEDGNSLSTMVPKLAGQNAGYISKQVRNFQTGVRKHAIMNDLAITISDDDLVDVAAYFASLDKMKGEGTSGGQAGKDLFQSGDAARKISACVTCHGTNGKGLEPNPAMIPVIGGQNTDYLRRQLVNFRKGDRSNSPDGVMNRMTKSLTDAEIESLAGYISGL